MRIDTLFPKGTPDDQSAGWTIYNDEELTKTLNDLQLKKLILWVTKGVIIVVPICCVLAGVTIYFSR